MQPTARVSSKINDASKMLTDPILQTAILLYSSYKSGVKGSCKPHSIIELASSIGDGVALIRVEGPKFKGSVFVYNNVVAAAILEVNGELLTGDDVLKYLEDAEGMCMLEAFMLDVSSMDERSKNFFEEMIMKPIVEEASVEAEEIEVLSLKIVDKYGEGPFSILYRGKLGERDVIIKLPRYPEESVGVVSESNYRLVQSAGVALKLRHIDEEVLYKSLSMKGYNETLAKALIRYRGNIVPVILAGSGNFRVRWFEAVHGN
ncbi:MAG: hypothetical protein GSR86_03255 [Desulfurococcales archaeon]|nr:hypothetical protein [Desulfurococcales archaeon]